MNEPRARYDRDEVADRLNLAHVADALGLKIDQRKSRPAKGDLWAICPFHSERSASLHIDARKGFYYCFGCHQKGDGFSLIMGVENVDFPAALERAAGIAGVGPTVEDTPEARQKREERRLAREREDRRREAEDARDAARARATALRWWRAAKPDPLIATYLAARGVDLSLAPVPPTLRLIWQKFDHLDPSCPLSPVMIAPFQDATGQFAGVHRTFLRPDGSGKYPAKDRVKRMFGDAWGNAIRLAPAGPSLAIAEGIESGLGWACFQAQRGRDIPVWIAGSSGNIADALTLPPEVREVVLIGDNDTKSKPNIEAELARAEMRLGAAGIRVRRDMPPRGFDFLDFWNEHKRVERA